MAIGLFITFHWHGTSLVEERAQYHKNDGFSLTSVTSSILIAVIAM